MTSEHKPQRIVARYKQRVRELEAEGLTRSDAQGVADAEAMQKSASKEGKRCEG